MIIQRVAQRPELAAYEDGTIIHVGLVNGHNNGIDERGVDHRAIYERRKAQGQHPTRGHDIRVMPVNEYRKNDGALVKQHWRSFPEDIERVFANPESDFHKMAKTACEELLNQNRFHDIIRSSFNGFTFGGCKQELAIKCRDGVTYYADIGVWDKRFKNMPVAFEVTYTSAQTQARVAALHKAGVDVFELDVLRYTRDAIKNNVAINVQFYRNLILGKRFRRMNDASFVSLLQVEFSEVAKRIDEVRRAEIQRRHHEAMAAQRQKDKKFRESDVRHTEVNKAIVEMERQRSEAKRLQLEAKPQLEPEYRHSTSVAGNPVTWTGRVVSQRDWVQLSEWDKHGPAGRHWNGLTRSWEQPDNNE